MLFRRGSRGENVRLIQQALKNAFAETGVDDVFDLVCDGHFGSGTEVAVIAAQELLGLKPDGVVGKQTLDSLGISLETPKTTGSISYEMLVDAAGYCPSDMFGSILPFINEASEKFKVNTKSRLAHFLSQVGHESGFKIRSENLSYSTGRMQKIFGRDGRRSKLYDQSSNYSRNPVALANYVYADRLGNGSEQSGDGFKYRGRGMLQVTGKDNYEKFTEIYNSLYQEDKQDFVTNPDLLLKPKYGVISAFSWWMQNGMNDRIDSGYTVKQVTKKVNGGYHGLVDRERRYDRLVKVLA